MPDVGVDAHGNAVAAWYVRDGNDVTVQRSERPAGGGWQPPIVLDAGANSSHLSMEAHVAVSAEGTAVVVWQHFDAAGFTLRGATRSAGGGWQEPVNISEPGLYDLGNESLGIDSSGRAVVAWQAARKSYAEWIVQGSVSSGGAWQQPVDLSDDPGRISVAPDVAMNTRGDAIVVWRLNRAEFSGPDVLKSAVLPAGGGWGSAGDILSADPGDWRVVMDSRGNALVVWTRYLGSEAVLQSSSRPAGGAWQAPVDIASDRVAALRLVIDPQGNVVAVWEHGDTHRLRGAVRPVGRSWEAPVEVSSGATASLEDLAIDPDGNAITLWSKSTRSSTGTREYAVMSAMLPAGGSWRSPLNLSLPADSAEFAQVAFDSQGDGVAVWLRTVDRGQFGSTAIVQSADYDDPEFTIEGVEVTQAIQEGQTLDELKADLMGDGAPPVPIVARKPAVLRVYPGKVAAVTQARVTVSGVTNQSITVDLQPQCTAEKYRRQEAGCSSIDFYFTPPSGTWTATLAAFDAASKRIEYHELNFASVATDALVLKAASVCDAIDLATLVWVCEPAGALAGLAGVLRKTSPARDVRVQITNSQVRRVGNDSAAWWAGIAAEVGALHDVFDSAVSAVFDEERYYYGMVRPDASAGIGGSAEGIPSRGAASRSSFTTIGVDTAAGTVAHETGHMLGREHTNTNVPAVVSPPGCFAHARSAVSDWPFGDNRIQSTRGLEVGFDVAAGRALAPESTFEMMSYCTPAWISPLSYRAQITPLSAALGRERRSAAVTVEHQRFWTIAGAITAAGTAALRPIYAPTISAPVDAMTGTHRIEILDAAGSVLFTRFFTPAAAIVESAAGQGAVPPTFYELVPVQAGAARVRVLSGDGVQLAQAVFAGESPTVGIDAPAAGDVLSGARTIDWSPADADSASLRSWVMYSADGGATWASLATDLADSKLVVDFDDLPGCSATCLVRVLVSDGANSATAMSAPFSVSRKRPTARISNPAGPAVVRVGELVWLQGVALDTDDGVLDDDAVVWRSDHDGELGSGASLPLTDLSAGRHVIEMRATDRQENTAVASTTVVVDGDRPSLDLGVAVDGPPPSCVRVTIEAVDEAGGSGLRLLEYSLDGGSTFTSVATPHSFTVPGRGFVHLVARAADRAGNVAASDEKFFIDIPCTIDAAAPETSITSGPAHGSTTSDRAATFAFSSSEEPSTFGCRIGTGAFEACSSPHTTGALADGAHTFQVRAMDAAGNADPSPASREFTVATSPSAQSPPAATSGSPSPPPAPSSASPLMPTLPGALGSGALRVQLYGTSQKLGRTISLKVSCTADCRATIRGSVRVPKAAAGARIFKLPAVSRTIAGATTAKVTLRLSRKARAAIARGLRGRKKVVVQIKAIASGRSGGMPATATRRLMLRR